MLDLPTLLFKRKEYINSSNLVLLLTVAMAATHLTQIFLFYLPSGQFKAMHLGFALTIIFAVASGGARSRFASSIYAFLFLASVLTSFYILYEYHALVTQRVFGPSTADVVVGCALIAISLTAVWQRWGFTIPLIALTGMLYGYFGNALPTQLLHNSGLSFDRLISYVSIPKFQGLLGSLTELSARTIFAFMLFAGLLKATGGLDFIMGFATKLAGRTKGGEGKIAVVASAFMGMISGSTVANVASTGTMTIPMMIRAGFRPSFAGAVESVASTGGQVTPPVMGLTAFLMVGITGISYNQVILSAAIPAVLYYFYVLFVIHLEAARNPIGGDERRQEVEIPSSKFLISRYSHLLIAIAILVYLLVNKMPPAYAAAYGCIAIVVLEFLVSIWRYRSRPLSGLRLASVKLINGVREGSYNGAMIAVVVAVVGILVEMLTATGFAQKLSYLILSISSKDIALILMISAVACIAFGLGLPTSASYILVALLTAPTLVSAGVPKLAAHMFVLYFAIFSALTPPVAVASLIASRIANESYFVTAFQSVKLGLPGFFLPFLFVARPELLLIRGGVVDQIQAFFISLVAIVALSIAIVGYGFRYIGWLSRFLFLCVAGLALLPGPTSAAIGLSTLFMLLLTQWIGVKRRRSS